MAMAKTRMIQTGLDRLSLGIGRGSSEAAKSGARAGEADTRKKKNLRGAPENKMLTTEEDKFVGKEKPRERKR